LESCGTIHTTGKTPDQDTDTDSETVSLLEARLERSLRLHR
jgi:hypothetical protein